MEIQIGIDTISFRHNLSLKQKSAVIKKLKALPNFKSIERNYEHDSYKYASDYFVRQGVKLRISRIEGSVWGLYVIIHPTLVLGDDNRSALYQASKSSYNKIVKTVDKLLKSVNVPFSVDDMPMYRLDVTTNLIFGDRSMVDEYIRILKKSMILPRYKLDWFHEKEKKAKDCKLANHHSHKQYCRSAAFFAYDKTAQLKMTDHFPDALIGKHILRLEAQLRRSALKKWVSGKELGSNWEIIHDICKNGKKIINWYLNRLQPKGNILRYKNAVEIIEGAKLKRKTRKRMLYLLRKTSDKESLSAALDALRKEFDLSKGQVNSVLKKFSKLDISPITLPNSSDWNELPPICL